MTLAVAALLACAAAPAGQFDSDERAEYARLNLERARELRGEGELARAERLLRAVLAVDPANQRARAMHVELLEELGRDAEAERSRSALLASARPLPQAALDVRSDGLVIAIAGSPAGGFEGRQGAFLTAVTDPFATQLAERLAVRLPAAHVTRLVPGSVAEARSLVSEHRPRAVVTFHARRSLCGSSRKDGRFAVADLDVTLARPGDAEARWVPVRETIYDLAPARCEQEIAARVLELALERPEVRQTLEAPASDASWIWPAPVLRALFPGLDATIAARVQAARHELERGQLEAALEAVRDAARMDPDDPALQVQLREAEHTLALSRELRASGASFAAEVAGEAEADYVGHRRGAPLEGDFVHAGGDGGASDVVTPPVGSAPPGTAPSDAGERLD